MPVLSDEAVAAAFAAVEPVKLDEAAPTSFPLLALGADAFEILNYALFEASAPVGLERHWSQATLMIRGADAGKDVLLLESERPCGVVQCKRLEGSVTRPAVLHELIKLVLFPEADKSLPKIAEGLSYFLSVARDPAATVVDFFDRPQTILADLEENLPTYVRDVLTEYGTLADIAEADAVALVRRLLPTFTYTLLRPVDLNGWLDREQRVANRFFRARIVVDNGPVMKELETLKFMMSGVAHQVSGVTPLTDADIGIIKARVEDTPESHRLALPLATFFGFPREMFSGSPALKQRVGRIARFLQEVDADYTEWAFARSRELAEGICNESEVVFRVHPIARQIPLAYLASVTRSLVSQALSGRTLGEIIRKATGAEQEPASDDERLAGLVAYFSQSGERYLVGDFSELQGDADTVGLKIRIIQHMMQGLKSADDIDKAFNAALPILRPRLDEAARELRALLGFPISIFLTGPGTFGEDDVMDRFVDSLKALQEMNQGTRDAVGSHLEPEA